MTETVALLLETRSVNCVMQRVNCELKTNALLWKLKNVCRFTVAILVQTKPYMYIWAYTNKLDQVGLVVFRVAAQNCY